MIYSNCEVHLEIIKSFVWKYRLKQKMRIQKCISFLSVGLNSHCLNYAVVFKSK